MRESPYKSCSEEQYKLVIKGHEGNCCATHGCKLGMSEQCPVYWNGGLGNSNCETCIKVFGSLSNKNFSYSEYLSKSLESKKEEELKLMKNIKLGIKTNKKFHIKRTQNQLGYSSHYLQYDADIHLPLRKKLLRVYDFLFNKVHMYSRHLDRNDLLNLKAQVENAIKDLDRDCCTGCNGSGINHHTNTPCKCYEIGDKNG